MSLKDNNFRNASAKLLIFPLSCKFSRWNIVKINRKCVAIFFLSDLMPLLPPNATQTIGEVISTHGHGC